LKYNITPPKESGFFRSKSNTKSSDKSASAQNREMLTGREKKLGKAEGKLMRRRRIATTSRGKPSKSPSGASTSSGTEVVIVDLNGDSEYSTPIKVGTPAKQYNIDCDTGSSDFWLLGKTVTRNSPGHNSYDPTQSSTAKQISGEKWSISYGDGSSAGGDV
jgi:hypothetical protein